MSHLPTISNQVILISALDWGFGHTTRCVSLIKHLLAYNNQIIFAGNAAQVEFIQNEFPSINTQLMEGYNIELSSTQSTYWQIGKQLSKLTNAIKKEKRWVDDYVSKNKVNLIISDNRYGFKSSKVKSVFMGHQLNVYVPRFRKLVNKKLSQYINQFNECWVVDDKQLNLAGELSSTKYISIPTHYIGLLNRFEKQNLDMVYDYLIIISGAYPENEQFLKSVEDYFSLKSDSLVVISTVKSKQPIKNAEYYYYPNTKILNQLINQSKIVVAKLGYTTLMEMVSLQKECILMPTKGQFEQEYLGKIVANKNVRVIKALNDIKN